MLGVAFVAGTFVLSDSLKATFDSISEGAGLGTDVVVRGVEVNQGVADQGDLRQPIPLTEADSCEGATASRRRTRTWAVRRCWSARTARRSATAARRASASPSGPTASP